MASRGADETQRLRTNMEDRLETLVQQLDDLEQMREELDDDEEYASLKQETMTQLEELQQSLSKMTAGDMSLIDELGSIQMAIQAAIRQAFRTPEVIRMFAKGEPSALRQKLDELEEQHRLGRIDALTFEERSAEVVTALKKMGENLSAREKALLSSSKDMQAFVVADDEMGAAGVASVLSAAQAPK